MRVGEPLRDCPKTYEAVCCKPVLAGFDFPQ